MPPSLVLGKALAPKCTGLDTTALSPFSPLIAPALCPLFTVRVGSESASEWAGSRQQGVSIYPPVLPTRLRGLHTQWRENGVTPRQ